MVPVRCGLDVLASRPPPSSKGRRVGLLCHQASVTRDLTHAAGAVGALRGVRLICLFAPEHGVAGAAQDHAPVGSTRDRATGLRVWSLYLRSGSLASPGSLLPFSDQDSALSGDRRHSPGARR